MEDPRSNNEQSNNICYSVAEKNHMLVITFTCDLNSNVMPSLEVCRSDILSKKGVTCVVLYFQNVGLISTEAISFLAQLQREIRMKPADLRLCSLRTNLRERLIKMGVIRGLEVTEDLKSALLSFAKAA